jgi:hypothetical protein
VRNCQGQIASPGNTPRDTDEVILKYGPFAHPASDCEVARRKSRTWNRANQLIDVRHQWAINGQLHGDDSAAIITARRALEAAYAIPFLDLVLLLDDGTTVHDALRNKGSTTGVRCISGPDFPIGKGAEGGHYLTYAIVMEAAYEWDTAANPGGPNGSHESTDPQRLESFTETVSVSGGGPRYAIVEVVDGPPVRQKINSRTKIRVVQSGQAVGRKMYPTPPGPLYPDWENRAERQVSQTSPAGVGQQMTGYQTSWTYVFEGPDIGGGKPNPWPL